MTCEVPGCEKPTRSGRATLCGMHCHRLYRHGSVDAHALTSGVTVSAGRRYKGVYLPRHPLASKHGIVYAHRAALYDEIGAGPHACHWCGMAIDWTPKGQPDCLQVDHLNGVGDDNRPENLVPSCGPCNTARGSRARHDRCAQVRWASHHSGMSGHTLNTTARGLGYQWQKLRLAAFARYGRTCHLRLPGCRGYADSIDHLDSRATHGPAIPSLDRVRPACRPCNTAKSNRERAVQGRARKVRRAQSRAW